MVRVWDHLGLKAKVRVIMVCCIIFDDQQSRQSIFGGAKASVLDRWNFSFPLASLYWPLQPRMDWRHFGKDLSNMENRTHGSHFGLAGSILENWTNARAMESHFAK